MARNSAVGVFSKVPEVTIAFWLIKIFATTVGETGGDAMSMTMNLGYAASTLIFLGLFVVLLVLQVARKSYHPFVYWAVVVATTTVGTTMSDYFDRTLGLGYVRSSIILFCGVLVILAAWHVATGRIEFERITRRDNEIFYWVTILVSNTLGTALGDFTASTTGFGFERGALLFAGLLAIVAAAHYFTRIPDSVLFWSAYVPTRPLGATLGDTLTKAARGRGARAEPDLFLAGSCAAHDRRDRDELAPRGAARSRAAGGVRSGRIRCVRPLSVSLPATPPTASRRASRRACAGTFRWRGVRAAA